MRIGLVTLDRTGGIALFNTVAEQILGYRAQEVRGKPCDQIFTGLTDLLADPNSKHTDGEPEVQLTRHARHKDGREVPLVVTPYATQDDENPPDRNGIVLIFQDSRELEKMENELQHLDRLQSLDQFAAGIVHEIRNPLAGISTNAQHMIEQIGSSDRFHEEMQDIFAAVKEIEDIVNKVLAFARPSESEVRDAPLGDLVKDVLRLSKMPLRRQGIQLVADLDQSPARVSVDVSQMKQVFFHIVRNACDAMPEGGELRVSIVRLPADNHVRVEVADTGRGISAEHLGRIFDPFFSTHREGTGLGLAISRKIVENHGGRIDVESEPGKGTTFGIVLPAV